VAAGGEELFGDQHCERRSDGTADEAKLDIVMNTPIELRVVASPGHITPCRAVSDQPAHKITVRIENAHRRHGRGVQALLAPRLAQEVFRRESRRSSVMLVGEDRRLADAAFGT